MQLLLQLVHIIQQLIVVVLLLLQLALQVCNAAGLLCKLQLLGAARVVAALQQQLNLQQGGGWDRDSRDGSGVSGA
jgi:hypothetical protein